MSRNWLSLDVESQLLDEVWLRNQQLQMQALTVTPQMAMLAGQYGETYPWVDPDVVTGMVRFGIPVDSPHAQAIGSLSAMQAAEDGAFDTPAEDVPDAWYERLGNAIFGWVKPAVRTGLTILNAPIEELQALLTSIGEAAYHDDPAGREGGGAFWDALLPGGVVAAQEEIERAQQGITREEWRQTNRERLQRFWTNYTEKAARSGALLALGDLLQGKHVDLGQGWLPGGAIYEERERAKMRLQLDGEFLTFGRLIARDVVEPGSTAYQVMSGLADFGLNLFADPSAAALKTVGQAARATRTFQATGLLSGIRKTVDTQTAVNHFLTSNTGRSVVRYLAKTDDVETAWRAIGKADIGIARALADARTETEVFDILSDVLGTSVRHRPTAGFVSRGIGAAVGFATKGVDGLEFGRLFGGGAAVRRAFRNSRLWAEMPGQVLDVNNMTYAATQLDNWARNARLPEQIRKQVLDQVARLENGDAVGLQQVTRRLMKHTEKELVERWGLLPSRAQKLTQMYERVADDLVAYALDDLGNHVDVYAPFKVQMGLETATEPKGAPMLISELVSDNIPLPPTAREIRRATAQVLGIDAKWLAKIYESKAWRVPIDGLDWLMSNIWKPAQLFRGAYTFRVIGEEQVRMAGEGLDSMLSNPVRAVAWSLSIDPKSRLGRKMAEWASKAIDPKGTMTVTGELWDDIVEHQAALSRGAAGHAGFPGEILTGRFVKVPRGHPDFYRGWTVELAHLGNDPIARRLAGGLSDADLASIRNANYRSVGSIVDDVKEWWWSGSGKRFREMIGKIEGRSRILTERRVADAYIDMIVDRLRRSTGGNADLMDLIATGRIEDITIRNFGHERKLAELLEAKYADAAPNWTKAPEAVRALRTGTRLREVIDWGFDFLMSKPTNWLSRSPTFRQYYWREIGRLIDTVPLEVAEQALKTAKAANVGDDLIRQMAKRAGQAAKSPKKLESIEQLDYLAKSFALDATKKLLYDLNKRSQFFDMARLIFPFGEAWKEIITAWTRILRQNPAAIRRFQQGVQAARSSSVLPGGEPGLTVPAGTTAEQAEQLKQQGFGRGFFHMDPQTGEEVFTYPAGWAGKLLSALPGPLGTAGELLSEAPGVRLVGRASGLNLVSATVLPGFGPAVQIPAAMLIPNTPQWDDLREMLMPFGAPEGDDLIEQMVDVVTPAWFDKLRQAWQDPETHRMFASTVSDVMRALLARGEHDISTLEGQQRLYDEAVAAARALVVIRGIAQANVPTGPQFQWHTTDVFGNVLPVKLLSDEYRRLAIEEYGGDWEAAFTEWVNRFGVKNVLALIGKSHSVVERPVTKEGDDWLRAHQDLERDFPTVVGYFAPEPVAGEFDYQAYLRQFETRAREMTTPSEQLQLANDLLGRVQWEQAKQLAALVPGPAASMWLADMREYLAEKYPGFNGWVAESQQKKRPTVDFQIRELRRAVQNPVLANTDAGQGIVKYLSALELAEAMTQQLPGNVRRYQQAKSAQPIRDWLRAVAREIIAEHPDFARVWLGVFERELADDDPLTLGGSSQ